MEYWSTLTTKGRRDVATEEEVMGFRGGKGFVSLCCFLADETNQQETPFLLSSSPIMDTKQISFKEKPDTVTLYLIVQLIQERFNTFQFTTNVLCTNQGYSESSVYAQVAPRGIFVLNINIVQCAFYFSYFQSKLRQYHYLVGPFYHLFSSDYF